MPDGSQGKRIPPVVEVEITAISQRLRRDHPDHKIPSAPVVRDALKSWMQSTALQVEDRGKPGAEWKDARVLADAWGLPSRKAIWERIGRKGPRQIEWKALAPDEQWSLGLSATNDLPPEATGALMTVWAHSLTDSYEHGFTLRQAKWVNHLRWLPEAGGSVHGEVVNVIEMHKFSNIYAAREKVAEANPKPEAMRTAVLDAWLMLDPNVARVAKLPSVGVLPAVDDIDWSADLLRYNPKIADSLRVQVQARRGDRPALSQQLGRLEQIEARFDVRDPRGETKARALLLARLGMIAARNDPRWQQLGGAAEAAAAIDVKEAQTAVDARTSGMQAGMLEDLWRAFQANEWDTWVPPLDALFSEALGVT